MPGPTFDLALGFNQRALQKAIDKIYSQIYPRYFTGSSKIERPNKPAVDVAWDVKQVPVLDLSPVKGLKKLLQGELKAQVAEKQLTAANLAALAEDATATTVRLNFPRIDLRLKGTGIDATVRASAVAYLQIVTINYRIQFQALRAEASTPDPDDTWVLNKLVIPEALKLAGQILSGIAIPELRFPGGGVMWPMPIVANNYLVILANDPANHYQLGLDSALPQEGDAFIVMKNDIVGTQFMKATRDMRQEYYRDGSRDLGISEAHWDIRLVVSNIRLNGKAGVTFKAGANVTGTARGWVTSFLGDIGMGFEANAAPPITGTVSLSVNENNVLRGKMENVDPFVVVIKPVGNVFEMVMGYVMSPLTTLATVLSPLISVFLKGISFDVWTVPDLPVGFDSVHFTIKLSQLKMTQRDPNIHVTGAVRLG